MLIILRGNACSGKSTIAEHLRSHFKDAQTAIIRTELFYWEIVRGDCPYVAMENTRRILDTYLKNGYHVVLEGTLAKRDEKGQLYIKRFLRTAKKHGVQAHVFFLEAQFSELKRREKARKKLSLKRLKELYGETNEARIPQEIVIDTSDLSINRVLAQIRTHIG